MPMTCNINRKGRLVRGIGGILVLAAGLSGLIFHWPPGWWGGLLAVGAVLLGAFMMIEARLSWCVMRALGFRTPI